MIALFTNPARNLAILASVRFLVAHLIETGRVERDEIAARPEWLATVVAVAYSEDTTEARNIVELYKALRAVGVYTSISMLRAFVQDLDSRLKTV